MVFINLYLNTKDTPLSSIFNPPLLVIPLFPITLPTHEILCQSLYLGLLLLLVVASLGGPIPEDILLLLGGALCRLGYGNICIALLVGLIGVLSGDMILFLVGRRLGIRVLRIKPFRYLLSPSHIANMKRQFRKRGGWMIFFGRFLTGVRSVMCITTGMCKVPLWKFFLLDFLGAICAVSLLMGLGWCFSDHITQIGTELRMIKILSSLIVVVLTIGGAMYYRSQKNDPSSRNPPEKNERVD